MQESMKVQFIEDHIMMEFPHNNAVSQSYLFIKSKRLNLVWIVTGKLTACILAVGIGKENSYEPTSGKLMDKNQSFNVSSSNRISRMQNSV